MSPLARSLLALAAAALLKGATAAPRDIGDQCTSKMFGLPVGIPEELEDVYINPGQRTAIIDIDPLQDCEIGHVEGASIAACDDVALTIEFKDGHIVVTRNGAYWDRTAVVHRTLWCNVPIQ